MKNDLVMLVSFGVAVFFLAGCGTPFEMSNLRRVQTGMTAAEVENAMGKPYKKTQNRDGSETWLWYHDALLDKHASIVFRDGRAIDVPADPTLKLDSAENIAAATVVKLDNYRGTVEVSGPIRRALFDVNTVFLRGFGVPGKISSFQVYFGSFRTYAESWAFWDQAFDSTGREFRVAKITSELDHLDGVREDIGIDLPRDYLESAASTGLNLRVYGKRAQMNLTLGPLYVQGFLKKVKDYETPTAATLP